METKIATIKNELPTIDELVKNVEIYDKQDKLNFLLNQPPPQTWVKKHPYVKNHNYIPIDKIEYLLRKIFKKYRIEILREGTSFNGVYVAVRVHYLNLIDDSWDYHDGIGAIHLQVKKGSSPSDLANINNGALSMAFPLAKTLAIKDACDMFGKLFGSDLNRRDTLGASLNAPKQTDDEKLEEIKKLFPNLDTEDKEHLNIERIIDEKEIISYNKVLKYLKK